MATDRDPRRPATAAAEMGLFGYAIPEEWGGLGLDLAQDVELAMEFGYTSLSFRSMFGTNNGIAGQVLVGFGTDEQKKRWLRGSPQARWWPRSRSPSRAPDRTRRACGPGAPPTAATGSSTGRSGSSPTHPSPACSWCSPAAGPPTPSGPGIAVFLVPADARVSRSAQGREDGPGRSLDRRRLLRRGAGAGRSALVGGDEDVGYRAAMTSLARGRIHIAALAVGSAQRALDESVAYAADHDPGRRRRSATSNWYRR